MDGRGQKEEALDVVDRCMVPTRHEDSIPAHQFSSLILCSSSYDSWSLVLQQTTQYDIIWNIRSQLFCLWKVER